ncbi:hypothetical protein KFL_002260040 [Klebsormidium nitens]|uniref:Cytochrome b561 domain-containing protein n=1 Tax=Klebsormidium nitens TaxID=105231 RepID=A0A1Y1IAX0_KLENI|nr:hypothetical protein KFL_002260040 [Klebsormidium nitens]|eukprot:GAQ85248.1 hypothetical protein KFL_002260040 [Klebsormidium nitens]
MADSKALFLTHGALMFLAFGVFFPLAIIAVKALRGSTRRFVAVHIALNVLGWILATIAIIIAYAKFDAMDTMHARIGTTVIILVWLQPFAALLRPKVGTPIRPFWFVLHWLFGTGIIVLGWANIFFGIDIYRDTGFAGKARNIYILYGVWIGILGLIILFLDKLPQLPGMARGDNDVKPGVNGHPTIPKVGGPTKEYHTEAPANVV